MAWHRLKKYPQYVLYFHSTLPLPLLASLHLAVLVLSARGELEEASRLCNQVISDHLVTWSSGHLLT